MSAELRAEFRLSLDKLSQDAQKAATVVQRETAKKFAGGGMSGILADPTAAIAGIMGRQAQGKWSKANVDIMRRAQNLRSMEATSKMGSVQKMIEEQAARAMEDVKVNKELDKKRQQDSAKSSKDKLLLFAKSVAAAYAAIEIFKKAVSFASSVTINAANRARADYARSLQSGIGLSFGIRRHQLAEILGVSETDVWRYGAAIAALNPKLEFSSKILARTNPTLTALGWQFKILNEDFSAIGASIVEKAAPAISSLIDWIDKLAKHAAKPTERLLSDIDLLSASRQFEKKYGAGIVGFANPNAKTGINFAPTNRGGDFSPETQDKLQRSFQRFLDGAGAVLKALPPQAFMKQLGASTLERIGLVMGGGGKNYAQETAVHTKKIASTLQTMLNKMSRAGESPAIFSPAQSYP